MLSVEHPPSLRARAGPSRRSRALSPQAAHKAPALPAKARMKCAAPQLLLPIIIPISSTVFKTFLVQLCNVTPKIASIFIYFVQKNCKTRKVAQILFRFLLFLHKGPGVSFIPPAALQKRKPPPAYYAGSGVYCTSKYVGHSHFFRTMTTTATAVQRAAIPMMAKKP